MAQFSSKGSSGVPVALVTGAASGIGQAAAIEFAKSGCHVVVADCDLQGAEETCKMIQDAAPEVESLCVLCDITCPGQVAAMIEGTSTKFGRLDYAFNNAGIVGSKAAAVHELPLEVFDQVMSVNLRGHFIAMQAEIPLMLRTSPAPAIVLTASIAGHHAMPGLGAYVISKHALLGLAKVAAAEYGPRGLRVNSISPGVILTPIHEKGAAIGLGEVVGKLTAEGATIDTTTPSTAAPTPPTTDNTNKQQATESVAATTPPAASASQDDSTTSTATGTAPPPPVATKAVAPRSASEGGKVSRAATEAAEAPAGAIQQGQDAAGSSGAAATAAAAATKTEDVQSGGAMTTIPLRRPGQAQDVAELAVWLCMHGAYVTGADVAVDGGMRSILHV